MKQSKTITSIPDDLAVGLAEIKDLLTRLSLGDTRLRADVNSEAGVFNNLKILVNQLADHLEKTNDDAHEMAIGLCEHYETLNRISFGDFSARATVNSGNEVVAKLGELINREADTLTGVISRLQKAEEAQQTQLQFLQVMLDTIPSPIFYKDLNCSYLGCNKAFESYLGYSRDGIIGKTLDEIWPRELAGCYRQQDLALFDNPGAQAYETPIRYADGSLRDVICNKATFNDSDGSVGGLVGVILDITERKRAEESVAFQNILLSTQQEASLDGILVVDEDAKILSFNRRFVEIMEIPSQLLETREDEPVLQYVTGRMVDPEKFLEKVKYLYQHRQEICRDEIALCNGKTLDRYTVPLLGVDGRYYGRLWSFRDITEYRLAEQEKSRLEASLHHARMMESFLVRLGHDLKTPLTPLFALLPLIRERVAEPDLKNMLDICCHNARSIKELTDKTRMLVKLYSNIRPYELESISLFSAVQECLADCSELMTGKGVLCQNQVDPAIVVQVVPGQINELFANLISNAVRYSPENGLIRIVAEQSAETVTIAVIDNGIGLAREHLGQVFDEFFKVDESRHDLEASGLGLSICRRIVQNHQGRIWAESAGPGQGTSIVFTLDRQFKGLQHNGKERKANG